VLILGHILHDWSLEQKQALLAKAHATLPHKGALIVFEAVIDHQRRRNTLGLLMSLNMLIDTPAGFDYTVPTASAGCETPGSETPTPNPSQGQTQ
jgi:hypothetical protein